VGYYDLEGEGMIECKKCYSTDEEEFNYDTLDDAATSALDDPKITVGTIVTLYEGDAIPWKASDFAPGFNLDTLSQNAYDNAGEYADDWPDCGEAAGSDLDRRIAELVDQWADEHGVQPNFYHVKNVKTIHVKLTNEAGDYEVIPNPQP
jgi:hypothetical protein